MPRPSLGPKLWLDTRRGTWTICDGRKRVRTGFVEADYDKAVKAIQAYHWEGRKPTPQRPKRTFKTPPRAGVYVIGFGPYIKIGVTENFNERKTSLQTPEKIDLHALFEGAGASYEKILHCRFAEYRLNGEWFRREGRLAEWVESGCKITEG
jgi:hypothetical protein